MTLALGCSGLTDRRRQLNNLKSQLFYHHHHYHCDNIIASLLKSMEVIHLDHTHHFT
jgi:hypothetical protein